MDAAAGIRASSRKGPSSDGMPVSLIERPNPDWTVARASYIMHYCGSDLGLTLELAKIPSLADSWVKELLERAESLQKPMASD